MEYSLKWYTRRNLTIHHLNGNESFGERRSRESIRPSPRPRGGLARGITNTAFGTFNEIERKKEDIMTMWRTACLKLVLSTINRHRLDRYRLAKSVTASKWLQSFTEFYISFMPFYPFGW